ncbi:MAG: hypothetical protein AVDCRST_MAG07-1150, partial [uncultured Frankineae bacterium]
CPVRVRAKLSTTSTRKSRTCVAASSAASVSALWGCPGSTTRRPLGSRRATSSAQSCGAMASRWPRRTRPGHAARASRRTTSSRRRASQRQAGHH